METPSDLITLKEASAIAGVGVQAVYYWVLRGKTAGYKDADGRVLVSRAYVERYRRDHEAGPRPYAPRPIRRPERAG